MSRHQLRKVMNRDLACGKRVNRNKAHIGIEYRGREYLLCSALCQAKFERNPEQYVCG